MREHKERPVTRGPVFRNEGGEDSIYESYNYYYSEKMCSLCDDKIKI